MSVGEPIARSTKANGARAFAGLFVLPGLLLATTACDHLGSFSTRTGSLEGVVEGSDLVRAGIPVGTRLCLELDTSSLQSKPGFVSTSDGRLGKTALRPIPALASDTLANLSFADGQLRNLLFAVRTNEPAPRDWLAIVSLLDSGRVELRLLSGAPGASGPESVYGVFALEKKGAPCSY